VVAASNVNLPEAIEKNMFRQDLFYRLNTVPVFVPPLRERKEDIHLLFRKFAADFAEAYRMPPLHLSDGAVQLLENYYWPGNIRQLKNVTEQISIIEQQKEVDAAMLKRYLPGHDVSDLPVLYKKQEETQISERELLYKVLFDMKKDMTEMKKIIAGLLENGEHEPTLEQSKALMPKDYDANTLPVRQEEPAVRIATPDMADEDDFGGGEVIEESLSLQDKENEMIRKALRKHQGKRKSAARELGISERTLYRKIKEYNIKE
jgi:transcriptional regulator with PAS, ATPase and Fis domain